MNMTDDDPLLLRLISSIASREEDRFEFILELRRLLPKLRRLDFALYWTDHKRLTISNWSEIIWQEVKTIIGDSKSRRKRVMGIAKKIVNGR